MKRLTPAVLLLAAAAAWGTSPNAPLAAIRDGGYLGSGNVVGTTQGLP
jgi:hypothetical protein